MPNLQCLFCKYVQYFTFRVQLYYFSFLWQWNEDECVACHRRFVSYIFSTSLLYWSFLLLSLLFLQRWYLLQKKVWFTRKSNLNLLYIKIYHAYAHTLLVHSIYYIHQYMHFNLEFKICRGLSKNHEKL